MSKAAKKATWADPMPRAGAMREGVSLASPGRPRLGNEVMKGTTVRMTSDQLKKLGRLGGGEWIRQQIDDADDPAKTKRTKGANTK